MVLYKTIKLGVLNIVIFSTNVWFLISDKKYLKSLFHDKTDFTTMPVGCLGVGSRSQAESSLYLDTMGTSAPILGNNTLIAILLSALVRGLGRLSSHIASCI